MSVIDIEREIQKYILLKPKDLIISDLKWKYLIRSIMRAKNIMIIGPSGCAKTMAARYASHAFYDIEKIIIKDKNELIKLRNNLNIEILQNDEKLSELTIKKYTRPFYIFNCGGGQDARATLIGNTSYNKELGTHFNESEFVKAIKTSNAIILLDEFTRGSHDFWNILFPVLDSTQRTLRLDEKDNSPVIKVADGVTFIATANIGNEFTSTRVLDKALLRRFPIRLEMSPLTGKELYSLFQLKFENCTSIQDSTFKKLCKIYDDLIHQTKLEDASITTFISPANFMEMAELVIDGFVLEEIVEAAIYPEYPDDGGADSERSFVKSIVQKYIDNDIPNPVKDPLKNKKNKS